MAKKSLLPYLGGEEVTLAILGGEEVDARVPDVHQHDELPHPGRPPAGIQSVELPVRQESGGKRAAPCSPTLTAIHG